MKGGIRDAVDEFTGKDQIDTMKAFTMNALYHEKQFFAFDGDPQFLGYFTADRFIQGFF